MTLASLFTVSCGIALLQVAANPYVAVIGPPETSESRLTLVQAFNTTGDVLAIVFGRYLILARTTAGTSREGTQLTHAQRMADAQATELPYLIVAVVLALLALMIWRARLPALGAATRRDCRRSAQAAVAVEPPQPRVRLRRHLPSASDREIGVGNLFINFASQPTVANITHEQAAFYLTFVWGGMMVGRFAGAFIMRAVRAGEGACRCSRLAAFRHRSSRRSPTGRPQCTG